MYTKLVNFFEYQFLIRKLNTWFGFVLLFLCSALVMMAIIKMGAGIAPVFIISLVGTAIILACLLDPVIALFVSIIFSFFVAYLTKFFWLYYWIDMPLGSGVNLLLLIGLVAVFINQSKNKEKDFSFLYNPLTVVFLIYIAFLLIELLNPNMQVITGWFNFFRQIIMLFCCYVIVLYSFKNIKFLEKFIGLWLGLALIGALYGCYQQWVGYSPLDAKLIARLTMLVGKNPFIHGGIMRQFSFFPDPTTFGMFMATSGIFGLILLTGPFRLRNKFIILFITVLTFLGMAYSGTRTAYAMVPAGIVIFILMTITHRSTLIITSMLIVLFGGILFGPIYGNATINRIRTAFEFSDDESMNLRDMRRSLVQPIIFEQPWVGGGVEASGVLGRKYDPNHYLAEFTIDSGFVKIAMETGVVGLFIIMFLYFMGMYLGVRNYYRCKNPELRVYIVGMVAVIYSLMIATLVQKSINQIPGGLILYGIFAILAKIHKVDQAGSPARAGINQ